MKCQSVLIKDKEDKLAALEGERTKIGGLFSNTIHQIDGLHKKIDRKEVVETQNKTLISNFITVSAFFVPDRTSRRFSSFLINRFRFDSYMWVDPGTWSIMISRYYRSIIDTLYSSQSARSQYSMFEEYLSQHKEQVEARSANMSALLDKSAQQDAASREQGRRWGKQCFFVNFVEGPIY